MRYPWNDAQFIGVVRDGTSRLSKGPSGDVSATCRAVRRSCRQERDARVGVCLRRGCQQYRGSFDGRIRPLRGRDRDQHHRQRQSDSSNRVVPLDQNLGPIADIRERPHAGVLAEAAYNRTPDGGGACSSRVFLRSTPPSAVESKLPSRESFPEPLLIGQRAVIGGEALNATFGPPTCPPTNSATSNDAASKLLPIIAKKPMLDLWCAISRSCMTTLDV
jgi:hypothetical protein